MYLNGYLTASRRVLPALNEGAVEAAMVMVSPVRGLRPVRAGRERVEKAPKPAIVTVSPLASASAMAENTALTAAAASDFDSEVLAATPTASSRLFIPRPLWSPFRRSVSRYRRLSGSAPRRVVAHLAEREVVFSRTALLTAALAWEPGKVTVGEAEAVVAEREAAGALHAARMLGTDGLLTTDRAVADERETIALMEAGRERAKAPIRPRAVDKALRNGPLTDGQKAAVKLILSGADRVVGVQGYAGSGKTTMLSRARALLENRGFEVRGLAPSASAARTLEGEAAIGAETLQRFLALHAGVAAGRMTEKGEKEMRSQFAKTVLVVDEGSPTSTV